MPDRQKPPVERHGFRGTGIYWSLPIAVVLGIAILIGIVQNTQSVQLRYLGWDAQTPLVVALLITMFATSVLTALLGAGWRRRRRGQLTARAELTGLRAPSVDRAPSPSKTPADTPSPAAPSA